MNNYTVRCLSETLSPLTHMSGTAGNTAIVAREPVVTDKGTAYLPFISGNALRHRAVREPGVLWLIDQYDLRGKLSLSQLNFLLHGGNLSQSNGLENTRRIAEMKRLWPLLRLCGASLPDQILAGSMDVWRGTLVCEENRAALGAMFGRDLLPDGRLCPAERFISEYQYTRGDAAKLGINRMDDAPPPEKSNLMIFSGQCVNRGASFAHGFILKHVSELELGSLLWSLRLWQQAGGTVGGQAARGHGRLSCEVVGDFDQEVLCGAYIDHVQATKEEAIQWLQAAFVMKPEKEAKPAKGKGKAKSEPASGLLPT